MAFQGLKWAKRRTPGRRPHETDHEARVRNGLDHWWQTAAWVMHDRGQHHREGRAPLTAVENECAHGSLPGDPNIQCKCWRQQ